MMMGNTNLQRRLVIQLERIGDLIQSTPAFSSLAERGIPYDLLVCEHARDLLSGMPGSDSLRTIPISQVEHANGVIAAAWRGSGVPEEVRELYQGLALPRFGSSINLSHQSFASWVQGAVDAQEKVGSQIRPGEWTYQGAWPNYLVALFDFRTQNQFNLADIYRAAAGADRPPLAEATPYMKVADRSGVSLPPGRVVAINPGTKSENRRWPKRNFAAVADGVREAGLVPVLVGAPDDEELCQAVAQLAARAPDIYCQTTLPEFARLLSEVELLVSNDTGALHIASTVGTPVVGVYGGASWYTETAPWGQGHRIVQGPVTLNREGLEKIAPVSVLNAALEKMGLLPREVFARDMDSEAVQVVDTLMLPGNADALGGVCYVSALGKRMSMNELTDRVMRHAFCRAFIGGEICLDYLRDWAPEKDLVEWRAVHQQESASRQLLTAQRDLLRRGCSMVGRGREHQHGAELGLIFESVKRGVETLGRRQEKAAYCKAPIGWALWAHKNLSEEEPGRYMEALVGIYEVALAVVQGTEELMEAY
jgi:ADP-heptose:LPS heptosyltransferase